MDSLRSAQDKLSAHHERKSACLKLPRNHHRKPGSSYAYPMKMTRKAFEQLVIQALDALPDAFKTHLDDVVVLVEPWPEDDLLVSLGMDPEEETLFGFYEGHPLTEYGRDSVTRLPDRIFVYQRPIEAVCDSPEEIVEEVRKTVMHEVGHFFGLDEDALEHL